MRRDWNAWPGLGYEVRLWRNLKSTPPQISSVIRTNEKKRPFYMYRFVGTLLRPSHRSTFYGCRYTRSLLNASGTTLTPSPSPGEGGPPPRDNKQSPDTACPSSRSPGVNCTARAPIKTRRTRERAPSFREPRRRRPRDGRARLAFIYLAFASS